VEVNTSPMTGRSVGFPSRGPPVIGYQTLSEQIRERGEGARPSTIHSNYFVSTTAAVPAVVAKKT
jgi:hypothetical protein